MRGEGVHEMTMNDHEGEGEGNFEMTTWSDGLIFLFVSENGCMNSQFEQHSLRA